MSANSRELRLARRALKAAITHLSQARGLTCMSDDDRELARIVVTVLSGSYVPLLTDLAAKADAHLAAQVRARRDAKRRSAA